MTSSDDVSTYSKWNPLRHLASLIKQLRNLKILAALHGQYRSILFRSPVDRSGSPIPWYTYPALEYLHSFDFAESEVFEFGAGNSSRYWARMARRVVSVEDNSAWFETVCKTAHSNQKVILCTAADEYVSSLGRQDQTFDVVIIDGKWRDRCGEEAVRYVARDGMIILDNSERHPDLCAFLRNNGFFQIDFNGFGPINAYCWTTSIFVSRLHQQTDFQGPCPVGGERVANRRRDGTIK